MYPIRHGYQGVENRLNALIGNGHHGEALLAAVFAMEKTIRRTLRYCALNRGFSSRQCERLFKKMRFRAMIDAWPVFERDHRTLAEFVGNNEWQHVPGAFTMRNNMVHGSRVYKLSDCRDNALRVKSAIEVLRNKAMEDIGCDPWSRLRGKKQSSLVWLDLQQTAASFK